MILKSFGCSFMRGSGLKDDLGPICASRSTWSALLARELNYTYECCAKPGVGNLHILEQIINQATIANNDLFVIGWSWIDRFDYINTNNEWQSILPGDTTSTSKVYYKELHSEYRDKLTNLSYIRLAIDILKEKNISFIMTCIDDLLFDQNSHISPAVLDLQNYIKPHIIWFENKSFLEWSRSHGFEETADWHPLEPAHKAAAEYIRKLLCHNVS